VNQDARKRRSDLFNHMVRTSPDIVLQILIERGLAQRLLARMREIDDRPNRGSKIARNWGKRKRA
jgi:hypothetical protein